MARHTPATEAHVRFYACLILSAITLPHWVGVLAFLLAGWTLFQDLRDAYREADAQHKKGGEHGSR
jgi:hypothetical protein